MGADDVWKLPGIGGELQEIYMETAHVQDIRFSWVAVTGLFSVIGSRVYRTPSNNYTSQYFTVMAKTSSGKDHIIRFIDKCLVQSGLGKLFRSRELPASRQGLVSTLKQSPSQVFIRDESGHQREASKTDPHSIGVRAAIMSVAGGQGYLAAPGTSERSLKDKELEAKRKFESPIYAPGITYIEISTAEKLTRQLTPDDIESGELGRFIIVTDSGKLPEIVEHDPPDIVIPDNIREYLYGIRYDPRNALTDEEARMVAKNELWREWDKMDPVIRGIMKPTEEMIDLRLHELQQDPKFLMNDPDNPDRPPVPVTMRWEDDTLRKDLFVAKQRELLERYYNQTGIHSKQHEHAMRLSLIYSLMDPETCEKHVITRRYAKQALNVIDRVINSVDRLILPNIADGTYQRALNIAVQAIREGNGEMVTVDAWRTKRAWRDLEYNSKRSLMEALKNDYPEIVAVDRTVGATPDELKWFKEFNKIGFIWVEP